MTVSCAKCDAEGDGTADSLPEGWENHTIATTGGTMQICAGCLTKVEGNSKSSGDSAADRLRLFIERIERLEEEKRGISDDIKDVYGEAKATGYDVKVMKEIVRRRRMEGHALREFEGLLEAYQAALGME